MLKSIEIDGGDSLQVDQRIERERERCIGNKDLGFIILKMIIEL